MYRFYGPSSLLLFLEWLSFYVSRSDLVSRVILVSISICVQILISCFFIYFSASHVATATPADAWCALLAAQSALVVVFLFASIALESRVKKYHDLISGSRDVREDSRSRHERRAMRSAMYKKESDQAEFGLTASAVIRIDAHINGACTGEKRPHSATYEWVKKFS
ncbi:hypothetical protein ANCCAN_04949 [Ancylostoma caninum]|uniref:Uncharacterized protein n=1 Tax=Ancylostoma caninum TaxID=29170 RepID=A0A368H166_ANCCA|nr:hypothetical protein ANCCAN_04949 [Ancylostoma caninum]